MTANGCCRAMLVIAIAVGASACDKSKTEAAGKPDAPADGPTAAAPAQPPAAPAIEQQASDAAMAELSRHYAKGPDGWTTAITSGSPYAPDHFLRQFRDLRVHGVESNELSDSDRLNGFEWAGKVHIEQTSCREKGDHGIVLDGLADQMVSRNPGRWSQWLDFKPEALRVQKFKGKWQVNPDTLLLRGTIPPH